MASGPKSTGRNRSRLTLRDLAEHAGVSPATVSRVFNGQNVSADKSKRVREAAEARGIGVTTLMRQWIEAGLAELDDSTTVSLADVRRAISALAGQHPTAA